MGDITALANGTVLLILAASLAAWIFVARCWMSGRPVVAWEPRRPVPWGLLHLMGLAFLMIGLQILFLRSLGVSNTSVSVDRIEPTTDPASFVALMKASSLAYAVWLCVAGVWMVGWYGAASSDVGWSGRRFAHDVGLGIRAFLFIAPVVYGIQFVLVQWWPSRHPLIEAMRASDGGQILTVAAISAVVMAPLFEEVAFRLLWQGWLENVAAALYVRRTLSGLSAEPVVERPVIVPDSEWSEAGNEVNETDRHMAGLWLWNFLLFGSGRRRIPSGMRDASNQDLASLREEDRLHATVDRMSAVTFPLRIAPILVSSVVFALLHYSHGPDWIPLLVLAGVLGYLYQRTHRIVPCIVVHALLNGVSFLLLLAELQTRG